MNIRPANIEKDALAIVDGAHDFVERAGLHSLFPSDEKEFIAVIGRVISLEGMVILLAEHEGKVVGGISILYAPYLWNPSRIVGDEIFWWTSKDAPLRTGIRLFEEAMKQIDEKKAIPVFKKLETSPKGVEKLYLRKGLFPAETAFMRF